MSSGLREQHTLHLDRERSPCRLSGQLDRQNVCSGPRTMSCLRDSHAAGYELVVKCELGAAAVR